MKLSKILAPILLLMITTATFAAHKHSNSLYRKAVAVERSAKDFAKAVHNNLGYGHLYDNTLRVAGRARLLKYTLRRRQHRQQHARKPFNHLRDAMRRLRTDFQSAHNTHHDNNLQRTFEQLESSYRSLRKGLGYSNQL